MLDIKFIRENKDIIQAGAKKKRISFDVDELIAVDDRRRALLAGIEAKKAEQNEASQKMMSNDNPVSADEKADLIEQMKTLKEGLKTEEDEFGAVMTQWQKLMVAVPNVPDISVPEGDSDADNVEIRTVGEIPQFGFEPKSYFDLMQMHDMLDLERGAKVSGFRGYFLKNDAVLLSMAIWQFAMQRMGEKGFAPLMVPSLVRRETLMGTGYIPQGEEDLYKTQDGDYLSGTAEVATMSYFGDEVIELPGNASGIDSAQKFAAFSPCFRREAGSHGKNTKGIYRVHEFYKVEQIVLCEANHETSVALHEELTANAEEMLGDLNIPYHVVVNCGADLGLGQVKKYDIEAWIPSEKKYGETHSSSYFHDFQTRRLNIRYRDATGRLQFAHSLNNTALATPRLLISLIENNQQEDGSIRIPEVLQPFMMGKKSIAPSK
jgi:seryl-tRNA synthetase